MARAGREGWKRLETDVVACRLCPRLVAHREAVAREKRRAFRDQVYWGRPVPAFGSARARLWIVGLAPGAHGANRTGRMFTGDSSGDFLYPMLHRYGFASQPAASSRSDGLRLHDVTITNVVKCVPPQNRPVRDEVLACRAFLLRELALLHRLRVVLALGGLAWGELVRILRDAEGSDPPPPFGHGVEWRVSGWMLLAAYHPSQQNTRTGRLTPAMLGQVLCRARSVLDAEPPS